MTRFHYKSEHNFHSANIAVNPKTIREWEQRQFKENPARALAAMEVAGRLIAKYIIDNYPDKTRAIILCGPGNNGGDGITIARYLKNADKNVTVFLTRENLKNEPRDMAQRLHQIQTIPLSTQNIHHALDSELQNINDTVIIDAMYGTGLDRDVDNLTKIIIEKINSENHPVIAVDIPSGLDAETGNPRPLAIRANHTLTLAAPKIGLFLNAGPDHVGCVTGLDIGLNPLPDDLPKINILTADAIESLNIPERPLTTNKSTLGRIALIGGAPEMTGALRLTAAAALRSAAGIVYAVYIDAGPHLQPEIIHIDLNNNPQMTQYIEILQKSRVIAAGPGLGQTPQAVQIINELLKFTVIKINTPLILDADALNIIAKQNIKNTEIPSLILTPHPAEAARLLHCDINEILQNPVRAAENIAQKYNAITVLKNHTTIIAAPDNTTAIAPYPNPAIAGPGFGDALTGIIAARIAAAEIDKLSIFDAVTVAVYQHAQAAKKAEKQYRNAAIASDLIENL